MAVFEYAPAPESRADRRPRGRRTACSSTASSSTRPTAAPSRRSTRPPRRCWPRSPRPAPATSTGPSRPPAGRSRRSGVRCPAPRRAKYLFRIARIIQERSRELAVLESLDNGKPIRESRDVDIPLVAAHFFYYAGWADKLRVRRLRPRPAAARRGRPGHPVELPAADAGLEDRPGAGRGQHRGAQAGRDHAADRAALRRDLPAGRPAAGRGQHRHRRRRRPAAALVEHPDVDKVAFTGSTEVGRADRPVGRRHPQEAHPGTGRQGRQHRLRRRPDRPGGRGHRQRHLLQPGARLLRRAPGCWSRSRSTTRCWTR